MAAIQNGWKYYNCGGEQWNKHSGLTDAIGRTVITNSLKGLKNVVVDNYEHATEEDKAILATMDCVEAFGSMGRIDGDWKIGTVEAWKVACMSVDAGLISEKQARKDFLNI